MELNNREIASLIWIGVFAIWITKKGFPWGSLTSVFKALVHPAITTVFLATALYAGLCGVVLAKAGLWTLDNLKATILWFFGFSIPQLFKTDEVEESPSATLKSEVIALFNVTVVITFLTEFYTLPLLGELVLVPVATLLLLVSQVGQWKPEQAQGAKLANTILIWLGLGMLGFAALRMIDAPEEFFSIATLREFAVTPILSLLFLPFLYVFAALLAYEKLFCGLAWGIKDDPTLFRYARWRAVTSFGLDIRQMKRWHSAVMRLGPAKREVVDETIGMIRDAKRRERVKAAVDPAAGWSPFAARLFLKPCGIVARDYSPVYGEWEASSRYKEIGVGIFKNNVAYYIAGTATAATRLKLVLHINSEDEPGKSDAEGVFIDALKFLLAHALMEEASELFMVATDPMGTKATGQHASIWFEQEDGHIKGRSTLSVTIEHKMHIDPFGSVELD